MREIKIFLAEDQLVLRRGLQLLLDDQLDMVVVGAAGDGREAARQVMELGPDIVIMDMTMPRMNGVEATRVLKKNLPELRILALTVHDELKHMRAFFEAGASGYVLKRTEPEELLHAIRKVAEGGVYLDPSLAGQVVENFISNEPDNHDDTSELSRREQQVVSMLAKGYRYRDIAENLGISVKTVETYRARAMEKLNLQSRAEIVQYAIDRGMM